MPIVRIDIQSGKSTVYKRALLHGVNSALVTALSIPKERIMQRIIETPSDDIDAAEIRSDRLTIVEISMVSGRDRGLKEQLYAAIADALLEDPGITRHDLVVLVNEGPGENFYLSGKLSGQASTPAPASPSPAEKDPQ